MKKCLTMFAIAIAVICTQLCVYADMGVPSIKPYTAIISNTDGAEYFDSKDSKTKKIEYGTKVEVIYEYETEDGMYASAKIGEADENPCDLKLSDITLEKESYISNNLDKENPRELIVLDENGVDIFKGPANAYKSIQVKIPYGTEIVAYAEKEVYESPWYYVTYNGVSGWVCELNSALGSECNELAITLNDVDLYIFNENKEVEVIDKVPAKTFFKNYIQNDPWSQSFRVIYNGKIGNIYNRELSTSYDVMNRKISKEGAKMYAKADVNSEVLIESIPVGTVLSYEYEDGYGMWIYTSYHGLDGFIYFEDTEYMEETIENPELPQLDESKIIDCRGKLIETLEDESSNIINENNDANLDNNDNEYNNNLQKYDNSQVTITLGINQIIMITIVTAVVASLTCIVIITLINKKTENNNNEKN